MKLFHSSLYSYSFLAVSIITLLLSCQSKQEEPKAENLSSTSIHLTDNQIKNLDLKLGQIETKSIAEIIYLNGKIEVPPQNMVTISVPLGGYVKNTHLLPGLHIKKGESIAEIEGQQYIQLQQDYLTIKTKLVYVEKEYARQKLLNESKAGSDKVYQQTESDYLSMKIELKSLSEKLKLVGVNSEKLNEQTISKSIQIYSPIDGFVSKVNINIGKYVNPSDILFELVNPTDIHLALTVFEKDIDKLFVGQKLMAFTNQNPKEKHLCEIILIGKDISLDKQLVVHCHFEDYDPTLVPGMYLNAEIELKSNESDAIAETAVVEFEGRHYVFENKGKNDYNMVEVEIGITQHCFTMLNNAAQLKAKKLVINDAYRLLMALKNKED